MKKFLGLDLSLCETGAVIIDADNKMVDSRLIKTSTKDGIIEKRFDIILSELSYYKNIEDLEIVYIEGLALNTKNAKKFEMGALHHMARFMLYKECIPQFVVEPKVLKKWMTGNGNASKDLMKEVCNERFGIQFVNDNLCDAFSLAAMAVDNYLRGNNNADE